MSTPIVSLIIPHFNHKHCLPVLLSSIEQQSLRHIEILVVDDCSEESCADVVEAFARNGLNIRLLQHTTQQFTKNTRLTGLRAAQAPIIAFADADDTLEGENTLEQHVDSFIATSADMLHFNTMLSFANGDPGKIYTWAQPYANKLEGDKVFSAYMDYDMRAHVLWNKLYSRQLFLDLIPALEKGNVHRYDEDFYLSSFLFSRAKRYRSSKLVGYNHLWEDKTVKKSPGRLITNQVMLDEFIPYLRGQSYPEPVIRRFTRLLHEKMQLHMHRIHRGLSSSQHSAAFKEFIHTSMGSSPESFLSIYMHNEVYRSECFPYKAERVLRGLRNKLQRMRLSLLRQLE